METHSSTLAWKIPWMEEPGGLQSMGSLRVRHDWATSLSLFTFMYWRRKWQPIPVFLPGDSQGWGSLVGCCLWGCKSQTWVKQLSSRKKNKSPRSNVYGSFTECISLKSWSLIWIDIKFLKGFTLFQIWMICFLPLLLKPLLWKKGTAC